MKLGSMIVQWVKYIPKWKDNRETEEGQLSLEIRRLRPIDELAEISAEDLWVWWEKRAEKYWHDDDFGEIVKGANIGTVRMLHRLEDRTRNWRNFEIQQKDGTWKESHDILDIFLFNPTPTGERSVQLESLWAEIFEALKTIAHATEGELKNFVSEYGGSVLGGRAPSVPVAENPDNASTPEGQTGPGDSPARED